MYKDGRLVIMTNIDLTTPEREARLQAYLGEPEEVKFDFQFDIDTLNWVNRKFNNIKRIRESIVTKQRLNINGSIACGTISCVICGGTVKYCRYHSGHISAACDGICKIEWWE